MLLRENYTKFFIPSSREDTYANRVYETVLFYEEEDPDNYLSRREATLTEYVRHDVKRYFGLDINQYLDLTFKEKFAILKVCEKEAKEALKAADAAKKNSDSEIKKIKESMNPKFKIPKPQKEQQSANLNGFDFDELYGEN